MRAVLSMLVLSLFLLLPVSPHAQVYRGIGTDGRIIFSDRPLPDAEEHHLPGPAAASADDPESQPAAQPAAKRGANPGAGFPGPYELFGIVSPEDGHRSRDPEGVLPVSLVLAPALSQGHRVVIEVDGIAAGGDLPNPTQVLLRGLTLGSHRVRALIQDTDAAIIAATPPINVHVLRPLPESAKPGP